jgi:hypothetical protein
MQGLRFRLSLSPAALEPFVRFAEQNTDENGWRSDIHRERISTWFGPSEFRALLDLRAQPVKEHDAIYLRGWNEGVERAAELLEDEGSSTSAEKIKALLDGRSQPVSERLYTQAECVEALKQAIAQLTSTDSQP